MGPGKLTDERTRCDAAVRRLREGVPDVSGLGSGLTGKVRRGKAPAANELGGPEADVLPPEPEGLAATQPEAQRDDRERFGERMGPPDGERTRPPNGRRRALL
jgi:hypothetical protein